ncbi:GNAT family N-acetyltransferase [bacterium SCSIO 12696]|nr:GNAT family N-acetyltransferase [bacterium SCSIO 12696]
MMKQSLETDRLIIRPMVESDFDGYLTYAQDAEVMAYIREVGAVEEIREHFNGYMNTWAGEENTWMGAAVTLKEDNTPIGDIGFRYRDKASEIIEIGYKFSRHHHGRGYGYEAMAALVELIKQDWPVHKLVAYADPENTASVRLMEKLGLEKEGHFKSHYKLGNRWTDEVAYGLVV